MRIAFLAERPADIEVFAPALVEHWSHVLPDDTLDNRRARLRRHLNSTELPIAWVAHEDGVALGLAALRTHDLPGYEQFSPWLAGVFVLPAHRRKGIAGALCRHVETHAAGLGYTRLYLFTLDQQSLYSGLGWSHMQRASWAGHQSDIMSKNIA